MMSLQKLISEVKVQVENQVKGIYLNITAICPDGTRRRGTEGCRNITSNDEVSMWVCVFPISSKLSCLVCFLTENQNILKTYLPLTPRILFRLQSNFYCLFAKFLLVLTSLTVLSNSQVYIILNTYSMTISLNLGVTATKYWEITAPHISSVCTYDDDNNFFGFKSENSQSKCETEGE